MVKTIGRSDKIPGAEDRKRLVETVNGIEIRMEWDLGYQRYSIFLPQIESGESVIDLRTIDEIEAEEYFEMAKRIAINAKDAIDLYKQFYETLQDALFSGPTKI